MNAGLIWCHMSYPLCPLLVTTENQAVNGSLKCECFHLRVSLICMGRCCTNHHHRCKSHVTCLSTNTPVQSMSRALSMDDKRLWCRAHFSTFPFLLTRKCWSVPHASVNVCQWDSGHTLNQSMGFCHILSMSSSILFLFTSASFPASPHHLALFS